MSDGKKTTAPSAEGGASPACATTTPCPLGPCQCGDTRWLDTQAYCGDNARIQASFTGGCPDGPATVEILHPTSGNVVDTISSNLRGGRVDAVWVAKSQTANWRTDRIRFRVKAAGQTCQSNNDFKFRQRPTTAWALRNTNRGTPVGFSDLCEKVDAQLETDRVHYSFKLKLTGTFTAAQQTDAKQKLRTYGTAASPTNTSTGQGVVGDRRAIAPSIAAKQVSGLILTSSRQASTIPARSTAERVTLTPTLHAAALIGRILRLTQPHRMHMKPVICLGSLMSIRAEARIQAVCSRSIPLRII